MFLTDATTEQVQQINIDWNALINSVLDWCFTTGIKLLIGIVVLLIVLKIINGFTKGLYKRLQKRHVDETIARVGTKALKFVLKGLAVIIFVSYIGIETAAITSLIASLGVGFSLALNGVLSNFAGGIIIILMRPFRIGDYITTCGESGTVEDIQMFYTTLVTPDNKVIKVPNGTLIGSTIVNVSVKESRRVDVVMSIAYNADYELARQAILDVCAANDAIYKDPTPYVAVGEYADSSVNLNVRVWTKNGEYWNVNRYLMEEIRKGFEAKGIEIPFNQLEVTVKNN